MVSRKKYVPDRGDIIWLNFNPQAGHEQAGHCPALVVTPKLYNEKAGLLIVCPITSIEKDYPFMVKLTPKYGGGCVLTDQLKSRLRKGLSDYLAHDLKLHIETGETRSETLADRKGREATEKQRAAEQSIASDPNIQAMQDAFGASVQDGSVQPLD